MKERFGNRAYALYTEPCIQTMGIDPGAQGLIAHRETIDILGDVNCWVRDLEDAWTEENAATRFEVTREDAYVIFEFDIAAPRQKVWEYFTVPGQRQKWWLTDESSKILGKGAEESVPPTTACTARRDRRRGARLAPVRLLYTHHTASDPWHAQDRDDAFAGGRPNGTTHLEMRVAKPKPKDKAFVDQAGAKFKEDITKAVGKLRALLEGQETPVAPLDEPLLLPANERFLTEPMK